jgi:hypothetical protein
MPDPTQQPTPQQEPALKRLHGSLAQRNKEFTIPYNEFEADMQDPANRKRLHGNLPKVFEGFSRTYDEFEQDMGFTQPPPQPKKRLELAYEYARQHDVKVPDNYQAFEAGMQEPGRLPKLYDYLKSENVTVPATYQDFAAGIQQPATPTTAEPIEETYNYLRGKDKTFTVPLAQFKQDMQDDDLRGQTYNYLRAQDKGFTVTPDEFAQDLGVAPKAATLPKGRERLQGLHAALVKDYDDIPVDYRLFENKLLDKPERLQQLHALVKGKYDIPVDYEEFKAGVFEGLNNDPAAPSAGQLAPDFTGPAPVGAYARRDDQGTPAEGTLYTDAAPTQEQLFNGMVANQREQDGEQANRWAEENGLGGLSDALGGYYNAVVPGGARALAATIDYLDNLTAATGLQGRGAQVIQQAGVKRKEGITQGLQNFASNNEAYLSKAARQDLAKDWTNGRAWAATLGSGAGSLSMVALSGGVGGGTAALATGAAMGLDEAGQAADDAGLSVNQKLAMQSVVAPVMGLLEEAGLGKLVKNPVTRKLIGRGIIAGAAGKLERSALVQSASKFAPRLVQLAKQSASEGTTEGLQAAVLEAYKLAFDEAQGNQGRKQGNGSFGTLETGLGDALLNAGRRILTDGTVGAILGGAAGSLARPANRPQTDASNTPAAAAAPTAQPVESTTDSADTTAPDAEYEDLSAQQQALSGRISALSERMATGQVTAEELPALEQQMQEIQQAMEQVQQAMDAIEVDPEEAAAAVEQNQQQPAEQAPVASQAAPLDSAEATPAAAPTFDPLSIAYDATAGVRDGKKKIVPDGQGGFVEEEVSNEDLELELDYLAARAAKGRLTLTDFQNSYFGQRTDTSTLAQVKQAIEADPAAFVASLQQSFATTQQPTTDPAVVPVASTQPAAATAQPAADGNNTAPIAAQPTQPENGRKIEPATDQPATAPFDSVPAPAATTTNERAHPLRYSQDVQNQLADDEKYYSLTKDLRAAADIPARIAESGLNAAYEAALAPRLTALPAVLHDELRREVSNQYVQQSREALASGNKVAADQAADRAVRALGALNKSATESAQGLAAFRGANGTVAALVEAADPQAAASKTVDSLLGNIGENNTATAAQAQRQAKEVTTQAKTRRRAAVQAAVSSAPVQAAVDAVAAEQNGESPKKATRQDQILQVRAERRALLGKLRQLNGVVGITPQEEQRAHLHVDIFRTYIREGVLQLKELVARFRTDVGPDYQPNEAELQQHAEQAVEEEVRQESADAVAGHVLARLQPTKPGIFDPLRELVNTLTQKVNDKLGPKAKGPKKLAREAIVHALQNRAEYAAVYEQSKQEVEKRIDASKATEATKAKWREQLEEYYAEHIGQSYADSQFARAYKQALEAAFPDGRTRQKAINAVALGTDQRIAEVRQQVINHVITGNTGNPVLDPNSAGYAELTAHVGQTFDNDVATRQQKARNKAGVYDEDQAKPTKARTPRPTLPQRLTHLYAARATDAQVSARLAPDFAKQGVQQLRKTVSRIAREHAAAIDSYGQTLKERLLQDATLGLNPTQAATLADAVEKAYHAQVKAGKVQELARRVQSKLPSTEGRAKKQAIDKLVETLNISEGLTAEEYGGNSPAEALLRQLLGGQVQVTAQDLQKIEELKNAYVQAAERKARRIGGRTIAAVDTEAVTRAATDLLRYVGKLPGVDKMRKTNMSDALWYAFILSNPATHVRNFRGNIIQSVAEQMLVNYPYALFKTGGKLAGQGIRGFAAGTSEGAAKASYILGTGYQKAGGEKFASTGPNAFSNSAPLETSSNALAKSFRWVTRALGASDAFSYQQLSTSRYYELATFRGMELARQTPGLTAAQVRRQALQYADEQLFRTKEALADIDAVLAQEGLTLPTAAELRNNPKQAAQQWVAHQVRKGDLLNQVRTAENPEWAQRADDYARRMTFNADYEGTLGEIGSRIGFLNSSESALWRAAGKILTPFTRVVTNVQMQRLEWAGLGLFRAATGYVGALHKSDSKFRRELSGEERVKSAMRSVYGLGSAALLYSLASAGEILVTGFPTGNRDEDKENPPFSVKVGGKWVLYKDTPVEIPMLLLSKQIAHETKQKQRQDDETELVEDIASIYLETVATWAVSTGPASGPADLFSALSDSKQNGKSALTFLERMTKNAVKSRVVPGIVTGFFQMVDDMADLPLAEKRSNSLYRRFMTTIFGDVPMWYGGGEEAIDLFGDVMVRGDDEEVTRTPEKQQVVEFLAVHHLIPKAPAPTAPELALLDPTTNTATPLTDAEYKLFMQVRGRELYSRLTEESFPGGITPELRALGLEPTSLATIQRQVQEGNLKAAKKELNKLVHRATEEAKSQVLKERVNRFP